MMHAGLDLSRRKIDVCLVSEEGEVCGELAVPADADGLRALNRTVLDLGEPPASHLAWSSREEAIET